VERDRDANGQSSDGLEERLYAQQDANYNITALVDVSGTVVERYVEDPYGQVMVLTAAWADQGASLFVWLYLHQGGRFENISATYHFRYRDLAAALGRWLQRDPIEYAARDNDLYRYLQNAPIDFLDANGLQNSPSGTSMSNYPPTPPFIRLLPPEYDSPPRSLPGPRVTLGPIQYEDAPKTTKVPLADFWANWMKQHPGLAADQYMNILTNLKRGCIGITVIELGIMGNPDLTNCYSTPGRALKRLAEMKAKKECGGKKDCYGEVSEPLLFSVRFWSDGKPYTPNADGKVDMSGWAMKSKPRPGGGGYVNFDFGLFDPVTLTYTHANQCDPGMVVYISNLEGYSRPLQDFDKQVFCVACKDWQYGKPARKP
jgi:RHS repeat-associated protein